MRSNVLLSALKLANDGAVVIRVYEAAGEPVTGAAITLHAKVLSAQEANLMEDSTAKLRSAKNTLQFDLHPFQIRTFKVRLAPLQRIDEAGICPGSRGLTFLRRWYLVAAASCK